MRDRVVRVAALVALLAGGGCATRGTMGAAHYVPRDREAMAVLVPEKGCSVIGGPETHIAFPGRKVVWRVVNLCAEDVELEITILRRSQEKAAANPFVEDLQEARLPARRGTERTNVFRLTVKDAKAFVDGAENAYWYRISIKGRPDSGIDPELDIWP